MYSSTLSLTSALDGLGGQRQAPAVLPPEMTRYRLYSRLGGPQDRSGRVRKIMPPDTGARSPARPGRSESPYRLSYPGSIYVLKNKIILQTLLHVSVPLHHLQGDLILRLLKL